MDEILEITWRVTSILEDLEVPYLVGGSLASSLHGIPRATQDVDIVTPLRMQHVAPLEQALKADFYVDAPMIRDAIRQGSSFNVIHLATMFKVDVFTPRRSDLIEDELQRRQVYRFSDDPLRELALASPEDMVVQKIYWYRLGGEVSDRQWGDVQGILKVTGATLDQMYLFRTAERLEIADLLRRALAEAGLAK